MAVAPNLVHLRHALSHSRARITRVLSPRFLPRLLHSKGSQSGEQGQFKAVTASQSAHEPRFVSDAPLGSTQHKRPRRASSSVRPSVRLNPD
ncbi:hypothetical protein E4U42_005447 [Claviceps africana]|uniref:Uncharacterized protein n=1 Tax=Claviceps africana TaxID=83212 RepID=A0A8K0J3R3_9HYPO|nr:hypothetical protein E4U42_005447 [Claviceps africana]